MIVIFKVDTRVSETPADSGTGGGGREDHHQGHEGEQEGDSE